MGKNIPKASKDETQGLKRPRVRKVLSFILAALGVWGVYVTTWVVAKPRVFVYPSVALDPANPAFTIFVVRNEGYLAIHDVKFECSMKYLKLPGGPTIIGLGDYTNRFFDPKQVARVIVPGEECSELLPLSKMEHNQFRNADIAVVLSFRPFRWLPCRWERKHRFETREGEDGQWHWLPQPINK